MEPLAIADLPCLGRRIMKFVGIWMDKHGNINAVLRPLDGEFLGLQVLHYSRVQFARNLEEAEEILEN